MTFLQDWKSQGQLSPERLQKLTALIHEIHEWNPRMNLTGFKSDADIENELIGESLLALSHLRLGGRTVVDFGSGAGIPGVVWAIAEPAARVTSVEIRQKKVAFQKEIVRKLELSNVEVVRGLFPDAVAGRRFDIVVTRAIRFSSRLWGEAEQLLAPGGCLVRYASSNRAAEPGWRPVPISSRSILLLKQL